MEVPVITHTALGNQALAQWPATVSATVTDNGGVDTVICYFGHNSTTALDSFPLVTSGNDLYENPFPLDASQVTIGDSIHYYIVARDIFQNANSSREPANGFHSFEIIDTKGLVLIVDDDPSGKAADNSGKTPVVRTKDSFGKSADDIQTWLDDLGYSTEKVSVATALNTDFSGYDLIISSSGANTSPVSDSNYRTKLENWTATAGNKLLIEGGELGYDALSSPGYSSFAANVLHSTKWNTDNAGNLQTVSGQESHAILNTPNTIPSPLSISYSGYGDEDAVEPDAQSYIVMEPANNAANAGVLVFDDDSDPNSAQIVYFAFNLAALNSTDGKNLLDNSVTFLLAGPIGAISGTVDLSDIEDDSGVSVYLSGDAADTLATDSNGFYRFTGLLDGTYTVKIHKSGYTTTDSVASGLTVNQDTVQNVDFSMDPIISSLEKDGQTPREFAMSQNYPNPFNPSTAISYQLPAVSEVQLVIYNALGQKVRTLVNKRQEAGAYSVSFDASALSSGVYYYRLSAGSFVQIHKMLLLK